MCNENHTSVAILTTRPTYAVCVNLQFLQNFNPNKRSNLNVKFENSKARETNLRWLVKVFYYQHFSLHGNREQSEVLAVLPPRTSETRIWISNNGGRMRSKFRNSSNDGWFVFFSCECIGFDWFGNFEIMMRTWLVKSLS